MKPVVVSFALALANLTPSSAIAAAGGGGNCSIYRWQTVDDFVPSDAALGASGGAVLATPTDLYVLGSALPTATTQRWLVRKSKTGTTWNTVDDYFYSLGFKAHPEAAVRRADGAIVVVGGANDPSNTGSWMLRVSTDGTTFGELGEFTYDASIPAGYARAAVVDGDGVLWMGGHGADATPAYHWLVRRSTDGGESWTTDDDMAPLRTSAGVQALATDRSGALWAAGHDYDGRQWRWKVRRRDPTNGTWAPSDEYVRSAAPPTYTSGAIPLALVSPERDVVFAAGSAVDSDGLTHWIVRRTRDAGASWSTVDDIGPGCHARAATYDKTERIGYVVGRCWDGAAYHWITRKSADGGATWTTDDDFILAAGQNSYANGAGVAPNGQILVAGMGRGASGIHHWIVRSRVCSR